MKGTLVAFLLFAVVAHLVAIAFVVKAAPQVAYDNQPSRPAYWSADGIAQLEVGKAPSLLPLEVR